MCHKKTHVFEKATTKLSSEIVKKDAGTVWVRGCKAFAMDGTSPKGKTSAMDAIKSWSRRNSV